MLTTAGPRPGEVRLDDRRSAPAWAIRDTGIDAVLGRADGAVLGILTATDVVRVAGRGGRRDRTADTQPAHRQPSVLPSTLVLTRCTEGAP